MIDFTDKPVSPGGGLVAFGDSISKNAWIPGTRQRIVAVKVELPRRTAFR